MTKDIETANDSPDATPIIVAMASLTQKAKALAGRDEKAMKSGSAVAYVVFPNGYVERIEMPAGQTLKGRKDYDAQVNPFNPHAGQFVTDSEHRYGGRLQLWRV